MKRRFLAHFTKKFELDLIQYKKGDLIVLEEVPEYAPAYAVVRDGEVTRDLITNEYGTIFKIVEEMKEAA